MNTAYSRHALKMYDTVTYDAAVEFSDQHALVGLLFQAMMRSLSDAERYLLAKQLEPKGAALNKAQEILLGLRTTLDFAKGGDLASDLDAIYEYCMRQLVRAHVDNDVEKLREARGLLGSLESAWALIPAGLAAQKAQ
jgi:flagellar protein FliS